MRRKIIFEPARGTNLGNFTFIDSQGRVTYGCGYYAKSIYLVGKIKKSKTKDKK